ncbi:MAG: hypothetical protein HN348_17280 [Proteobacteria bacterium]|jgi:phosphatidylglycerol---prolipoprotein diacylglyceryl transferase|nr:hypothetical protein [Pseudomonadota bacterium]
MIPFFEVPPFQLGPITLQPFGVLSLLGIVSGGVVAALVARGKKLPMWPYFLLFAAVFPIGLVGGLAYSVVFLGYPALSATGFLFGWVPIVFLLLFLLGWRRFGERVDAAAIGLVVAWAMMRVGCFVVHDHPGSPTSFFLGVKGICRDDMAGETACHDLGLYELLYCLVLLMVMAAVVKKTNLGGLAACLVPLTYGPLRLVLDNLYELPGPFLIMLFRFVVVMAVGAVGLVVVVLLGQWAKQEET